MATTAPETPKATIPEWTLGDRIWKARRNAGLEQEELADLIGVSKSLVSKWERGQRDPRVAELVAVAKATNVDQRWLLSGELPLSGLRQRPLLRVIPGGATSTSPQRTLNLTLR